MRDIIMGATLVAAVAALCVWATALSVALGYVLTLIALVAVTALSSRS